MCGMYVCCPRCVPGTVYGRGALSPPAAQTRREGPGKSNPFNLEGRSGLEAASSPGAVELTALLWFRFSERFLFLYLFIPGIGVRKALEFLHRELR